MFIKRESFANTKDAPPKGRGYEKRKIKKRKETVSVRPAGRRQIRSSCGV